VGHLDLAYDYLAEAAFMDLQDREHNTKDGLHIASLAGAWTALVGGFGGMRCTSGSLAFSPQLPPSIVRLSFRLRYRGRIVHVEIQAHKVSYSLLAGDPMPITHHGEQVTLGEEPVVLDIPLPEVLPSPSQPYGRAPQSRRTR
jgi:alpha,alpha-trehalose phosphorylase